MKATCGVYTRATMCLFTDEMGEADQGWFAKEPQVEQWHQCTLVAPFLRYAAAYY